MQLTPSSMPERIAAGYLDTSRRLEVSRIAMPLNAIVVLSSSGPKGTTEKKTRVGCTAIIKPDSQASLPYQTLASKQTGKTRTDPKTTSAILSTWNETPP